MKTNIAVVVVACIYVFVGSSDAFLIPSLFRSRSTAPVTAANAIAVETQLKELKDDLTAISTYPIASQFCCH